MAAEGHELFVHFYTPDNTEFSAANTYRPLDRECNGFRVLEILPGEDHDFLESNLLPYAESHEFEYEAPSHRAGDPKETQWMRVDGRPFRTFATLFGSLLRLRYPDKKRVVWADQICINQNDVVERSHQVKNMRAVEGCDIVVPAAQRLYQNFLHRMAAVHEGAELISTEILAADIEADYTAEFVIAHQSNNAEQLHVTGALIVFRVGKMGKIYRRIGWQEVLDQDFSAEEKKTIILV